uniref:Uncharacterized protein n=1 Tax=Faecalibaculum rodentium TaxID=1702221 RepID=A0A140DRF7_9FIRM|nr:hypothetical protein AALO17_01000 [Faecalibaculum rodentium]
MFQRCGNHFHIASPFFLHLAAVLNDISFSRSIIRVCRRK